MNFTEELIDGTGIFKQCDLDILTPKIGDSIGFYFASTSKRTGDQGEFIVCEGLQINLNAKSNDDLLKSAEPINFIPRTVLENKIKDGLFLIGQAYRIEKQYNKGDTVKGKKINYFSWKLFKIAAPQEILSKLNKKLLDLQGKDNLLGTESEIIEF